MTRNNLSKLKILFVIRARSLSQMGIMAEWSEMSLIGPLGETRQADYEQLWIGPWMERSIEPMDWSVFQRCLEYQPDVLFIYGWWVDPDDELKAGYLALFTFYLIRKLLNIKIVGLPMEQAPHQFETSDNLTRFCDLVFTYEDEDHFRNHSAFPEKHIATHHTPSPKLFHSDPRNRRDIDLVFVGKLAPVERFKGISALRHSGLAVTTPGVRDKDQIRLSNEEYANFHKRSKIVINWSRHWSGRWFQAKGRMFDATLAGAMLLCEECKEVNRWFQPYIDYVPFSNPDELVQRARYYLEHEEERLRIAVHGNRTALTKYSADVRWGQMLRHMREKSLYREAEAVEGLRRNASLNELRVARFFQRELKRQFPEFDQSVIDGAVAIVEKGNKSFVRRVHWHTKRLRWRMRGLHWRILRKLLPSFITRKRLRSVFNSLLGNVVKNTFTPDNQL